MAALEFYDFLRARKALVSTFKGKKTIIGFLVDKDIDDILRRKRRSPHVVYTKYYDVENHIFAAGDLREAAASSASLNRQSLSTVMPNSAVWCKSKADIWRDWVKVCVLAKVHAIPGASNLIKGVKRRL